MTKAMDLPIALRRTRRSSVRLSTCSDAAAATAASDLPSCLASVATPRRRGRAKKRVRFSDPGPSLERPSSPSSTGLTPMVRRTSLQNPSPKSRRHSTPARPANGAGLDLDAPSVPFSGEVTFLPLRQVLDGRVKRRIRRNGLSEEMNGINAEKKRRVAETKAEIGRLRAEVAEKDAEIQRLQDDNREDTMVQDTDRILELERQVEGLRRELACRSGIQARTPDEDRTYDWTIAARDPYAGDYTAMDISSDPMDADNDDEFGQITLADLQCSTPTRASRARASIPTPPTTSPAAMPMTPCSHFSTPRSHAGIQVEVPDVERQNLEEELASLQLEICKLTTTLESYQSLTSHLAEKLEPFAPSPSAPATAEAPQTPNPNLDTQLSTLLQTLSDRTAALLHVSSSLSELGFPGSDASEIIASLSSAFRTARLELEYMTPGEITLPLNSAGAEVLDLLLTRLRDLARRSKEADDEVDEYHELELSLRKQLGARVESMDGLAREVSRLEAAAKAKDEKIGELEVGVQRLKGAVATYTRDMSELERLVERMEGELVDKSGEAETLKSEGAALKDDVASRDQAIAQKAGAIAELEAKLAGAMRQTDAMGAQLAAAQEEGARAQEGHKRALASLGRSQGQALALRDGRVAELRGEIDRVNGALRAAHETIRQLRVESSSLSARLDDEKGKAKAAIDAMKAELERVVRMSQDFLTTPKKARQQGAGSGGATENEGMPSSVVRPGDFLSGDLARKSSNGKKRRRYDSGLGFLDEEELDFES